MKKFISIIALATVFAACSKENAPQIDPKEDVTPSSSKEVILFAEIPAMIDDTKAIADGSFSWAENDEIAIPISGGYAIFAFDPTQRNGQGAFTYTLTGSETFINGKAYYPASSRPSGDYSTNFANPDAARAGFMMEADYHVGDDHIDFTHKSSLIDLNFSNVPSFATSVQVKEGETVVATVALSSPSSSVEVKVPVTPNGSKTYTFSLMENSNIIKQVSKSGVTLTAGRYYKTPAISIGHVIRIQDNVSWSSRELYIWNVVNTNENALFMSGYGYPYKFNSISEKDHYIIIPSELTWIVEGSAIGVKFQDSGASHHTETDCIYLYRDFTFDVPSDGGMKTAYRVYYDNSSSNWTTVKAFVWGDIGIYVRWYNWSDRRVYYRASDNSSWGWGTPTAGHYRLVFGQSDQYAFYEVPEPFWSKTIDYLGIGVDGNSWEVTNSAQKTFNNKSQFFYRSDAGGGFDKTESTEKNTLTQNAFPGDAVTSDSGRYYYQFTTSEYGYGYNIIFSDDTGAHSTYDTHLLINREYTLPL